MTQKIPEGGFMFKTKEELKEAEKKLLNKLGKLRQALNNSESLDDELREYCILCAIDRVGKNLQEIHEEEYKF